MTPSQHTTANACDRTPRAVMVRGVGFGGQYWYWFSSGVPAAGS
jgi:hypothetical protein